MKRALAHFFGWAADTLDSRRVSVQRRLADIILQGEADAHEIRRLEAEVRQLKVSPPIPEFTPDWTADNAAALLTFLNSDHGKIFIARLTGVALSIAVAGAKNKTHTIHAAGVSAGWDECVRYINSLSRVSGVQDTKAHAGPINLNYGQPPQDEAALLDLLSP